MARLPPPAPDQTYVSVSALHGGQLTLSERLFVTDADPNLRSTVPSMCFLITHPNPSNSNKPTRLVFDLGIKRDLTLYAPGMRTHLSNRQPIHTSPDVRSSLLAGGLLDPATDIDLVILSHTHWDHIGQASDYPHAHFYVGSGTLHTVQHGAPHYPADLFEAEPLPLDRTFEFPSAPGAPNPEFAARSKQNQTPESLRQWRPLSTLAHTIDLFGDGSVYVVDAPGHLQGHVNLLCRISAAKWVYLGGDCCHDPRIMMGEKGIAEYDDGMGGRRSVHSNLPVARGTVEMVREFLRVNKNDENTDKGGEGAGRVEVEWIIAHDKGWAEKNQDKFWPGRID